MAVLLCTSSTLPPGRCARTTGPQINDDAGDDYDIHIPLSAIPLGVNIGPSLEVLGFAKDAKTGELPWVAQRGWLEVGDVLVSLVSLEGEYMSEVIMIQNRDKFERVFSLACCADERHPTELAMARVTCTLSTCVQHAG